MSELKLRPVLFGAVVDVVGTYFAGVFLFAAVGTAIGGTSPDDVKRAFDASAQLQLATVAVGALMTMAGAYVAAWLAKTAERVQAFAVGVISTIISFTLVFASPESAPFWAQALGLMLLIPAAFVGGEIRRLTKREGPKPS